jgi:hypothetical protein
MLRDQVLWVGGREGKGREGKGREGKGREGKGREGKGFDAVSYAIPPIVLERK